MICHKRMYVCGACFCVGYLCDFVTPLIYGILKSRIHNPLGFRAGIVFDRVKNKNKKGGGCYFTTIKRTWAAAPISSIACSVCAPIGTAWTNVSPGMLVPMISPSRNQNIFAAAMSVTARIDIWALSRVLTTTVRVPSAGDVITGAVRAADTVSKSPPGISGGGV